MTAVPIANYVSSLDMGKAHHRAWLQAALEELVKLKPDALDREGSLHSVWSAAVPASPVTEKRPWHTLAVPYYSQRDSATGQSYRMCFSSSCAMLVNFLRPGALGGPNGDDQYLRTVESYGDTTDAQAQLRALAKYGVKARFVQDADFRLIQTQIARGVPVPCGYLHRGPIDSPSGGGHWLIVTGTPDAKSIIVNDPFGEPDLLSGATLSSSGKGLVLTRENFGRRWMVEAIGGGAYRYAPGRGWAIVAEP